MAQSIEERLKRIQIALRVDADGKLGPKTLSAIEAKIFSSKEPRSAQKKQSASTPSKTGLTLSKKGVDFIIAHEISSKSYYEARLTKPTWPGGASGITIGIGYDMGYCSVDEFEQTWSAYLSSEDLSKLKQACGIKGAPAEKIVSEFSTIKIPYSAAENVFTKTSIPAYAKKTQTAFPGIDKLEPDAQAAILSLVYNRGTSMKGDSRKEMLDMKGLIENKDYAAISTKIEEMKRLWKLKGLDGLLKRRDEEADMVKQSVRIYQQDELIHI